MPGEIPTSATALLPAAELALTLTPRKAANGLRFACFGPPSLPDPELARIVQAVPETITGALHSYVFYFVPLALPQGSGPTGGPGSDSHRAASDRTLIAPHATPELSDEAICHRNVTVHANPTHEGVFISAGLLRDTFSLAFEFFINIGHLFVGAAGIPEPFARLAWTQALADVRGETSQDAWESRHAALAPPHSATAPDERARTDFIESSFADTVAIYLLSLALDFDYAELREREYPLLAPSPLADRLRLIARLFPPNPNYEFTIRYRRRP